MVTQIKEFLNGILDRLSEYLLNYSDLLEYKKFIAIGTFLLVILSVLAIISGARITKKMEEFKTKTESAYVKHQFNRYLSDYIPCKASEKLDEMYKFSRIYKTLNGKNIMLNTSFKYWAMSFVSSFIVFGLALLFTKHIIGSILICALSFGIWWGNVFFRCYVNNKNVDGDIMKFINLLGNYSTATSELTALFMQIAPKMHEPLRSCLIECVAEAQNTEKAQINALINLSNKIEHAKFREIIKNIEISRQYISNYGVIAEQSRVSAFNYSKGKRQLTEMVKENTIVALVCLAGIGGCLYFMGSILEVNMFTVLTTTAVGMFVLAIAVACMVFFVVKLFGSNR